MAIYDRVLQSMKRDTYISEERELELMQRVGEAMYRFSTPRNGSAAPLYTDILSTCTPLITRSGKTLFVRSRKPYGFVLGLNPDFILGEECDNPALAPGQVAGLNEPSLQFILAHEPEHVLANHIGVPIINQHHRTAREIAINYRCQRILGLNGGLFPMPTRTDPKTGQTRTTGIDPQVWFDKTVLKCQLLGITPPADLVEFAGYEMDTLDWLMRARIPPAEDDELGELCDHDGDGTGDGVDSPSATDGLDDMVERVVREAALTTGAGTPMDRQLNLLKDLSGSEGAKMWGSLGVGAERGSVLSGARRNRMPIEDLAASMATRLDEGDRLKRNHKSLADNEWRYRGRDVSALVAVHVDGSGSVGERTLQLVQRAIGLIPGAKVVFHTFDTEVYPHDLGAPLRGGGGTDFASIEQHIRSGGRLADGTVCDCCADGDGPDLVAVITDGYAEAIHPDRPDSWFWIITPGGDARGLTDKVDMPVLALTEQDLENMAS